MKILVTGGCGFIGSQITKFHLDKGDEVFVVDNLSTGTKEHIEPFLENKAFQFEQANILNWDNLKGTITWADRIYNFAATVGMFKVISEQMSVIQNNIIACNHILQAVAETQTKPLVVIASSSSVYGDNPKGLLSEEDSLIVKPLTHPLATYAISKLSDEAISYAYYKDYGIPLFVARMFNTIGPGQTGLYGMVVPRFISQACNNEPITVYGDGKQTRSFCDVRDIVVALDLLSNEPKAIGQSINIGNDYEISIYDLAKLVKKLTNSQSPIECIPYKEAYGMDYTDIGQRRPDLKKLKSLISFQHAWDLENTINDLVNRYRNNSR